MVKKSKEESLENKLYVKLNKLTPEGVEAYLDSLLRKCLEAVLQEDYLTLGSLEDVLNKSIGILAYKISNFNLLYSNVKLKIVTEYLAKYINVEDVEALNFIKVVPEFINAETVEKTLAYKKYERHFYYFDHGYFLVAENEAYSIIQHEGEQLTINFKGNKEIGLAGIGYNIDYFEDLNTLKAFMNVPTEEESEHIKYLNIKKELAMIDKYEAHYERWERFNKQHPLKVNEDGTYYKAEEFIDPNFKEPLQDYEHIYYNKENERFIAIIDKTYLVIYDKQEQKRLIIWTTSDKEFFYKFCDYCLGLEPKELEVPEESSEVDPTEEAAENNSSENAVPINEG